MITNDYIICCVMSILCFNTSTLINKVVTQVLNTIYFSLVSLVHVSMNKSA